ncbi:hypothetical protein FRC10_003164 [Ceratobasidium sp. 414]|nr:hypothetical protein FRC10_003164 [Ceratobasidium sp. 414]
MPRSTSLLQRTLRGPRKFISEGPYIRDTTQRFGKRFPCFYCSHILRTEGGRVRHILLTRNCRLADEQQTQSLPTVTGDRGQIHVPDPVLDELTEPERTSPADPECNGCVHSRPSSPPVAPLPPPPSPPNGPSAHLEYDTSRQVFVERYPDPRAGAPINDKVVEPIDLNAYMAKAGNLGNPDHFDTGELLMTTGLTNVGRDAHLKSRLYKGKTPWINNKNLIADIDKLPHGPGWKVFDIRLNEPAQRVLRKHSSYLFMRSIVATFRDLLADSTLKGKMQFTPRQEWTAKDQKCRVYGETSCADWWWRVQVSIAVLVIMECLPNVAQGNIPDKFATIVPLIISHDRTTLSLMAGSQTAYPVYMTLANIDKSVRRKVTARATTLLAYLPTEKFAHVLDDNERSRLRRELIHRAMEKLFDELRVVSKEGIETLCADGRYRRAYPIVAGLSLDFEEQVQMSGIVSSGCPKCRQGFRGRGSGKIGPPRTNYETLCAMHAYLENGDRSGVDELGLQPIWPWWANIPYMDFAACLMPDTLHQLHQGMLRHLLRWTIKAAGEAQVDQYFMSMPTAEGMRHFKQGVSGVKQWTGRESKEVEKQLLPVVACLDAKRWDQDFVRLTCALLDFMYRSQASRMTEDDVVRLEKTLAEIHQLKGVLLRMQVFKSDSRFDKITKLHQLSHWPKDIRQMGTPDGFSTESPEHMHIESKHAWLASNKVQATPQMIRFIQRYEALRIHRARMDAHLGQVEGHKRRRSRVIYEDEDVPFHPVWEPKKHHVASGTASKRASDIETGTDTGSGVGDDDDEDQNDEDEDEEQQNFPGRMRTAAGARQHVVYPNPMLSIAVKPTVSRVRGIDIIAKHGAVDLVSALHTYLNKHGTRRLPPNFLPTAYHEYPIWHRLYLRHEVLLFDPDWARRDVIRARPADEDRECAFDVALILDDHDRFGLHRYRAGRVRAIFSLPRGFQSLCRDPLVYVELFSPFSTSISPHHRMHSLSHLRHFDGKRRAAVLSAFDLATACHLAPRFNRLDPDLDLSLLPDLLTESRYFFFNHYYNRYIYHLIDHWRRALQG